VCGILIRNRSFALLTVRRFSSQLVGEGKSAVKELSWKELANLNYGKETKAHRQALKTTLNDLRRAVERWRNDGKEGIRDLKLIEIGSYAVGTSSNTSDLDVLAIPYSKDRNYKRIEEFQSKMNMENDMGMTFRRSQLLPMANRISASLSLHRKASVRLRAQVPIIHGITNAGIIFDVQVGSIASLYSSNFVRLAFALDPRLIIVYHWLRERTEKSDMFGGPAGLFTPFHLYMLILHFAQATEILPVLMEEYGGHLSSARHWRDIAKEYWSKNVISPLYSTDDLDEWAPVLTKQLVEYYASIDFKNVEINVGRGVVKERSTEKNLLLIEPFHDQENGVCRVNNGAELMNELFAKLKNNLS
ncbi:hypothetical protein PMAYCL1PPCAC_13902, partial [Pristionchus mayeri]